MATNDRVLDHHDAVDALRALLPEATVVGGSFHDWLPLHPRSLQPSDRERSLDLARRAATERCIADLLERMGRPIIDVGHLPGGERAWPPGLVGSLSHKGTTVVCAAATTSSLSALGVDLERIDRSLRGIHALIAPEGLPPMNDADLALLVAFSAKEAVFKAQYPLSLRMLEFSDIVPLWAVVDDDRWSATVGMSGRTFLIRCSRVGRWLLSAAITQVK